MQKIFLAVALLLHCGLSIAGQNVGGMLVDYGPAFQPNEEKARAWQAKMTDELRSLIQRLEISEAPPTRGLAEVRLLKIRFVPKTFGSVDAAATESVANIVRLPGVKNPRQNITAILVSGLDARRVSFESDRNEGKLGAEFLIVHDKRTNIAYQLQIIFGEKQGLNPFRSLNLSVQRDAANEILASVRMAGS